MTGRSRRFPRAALAGRCALRRLAAPLVLAAVLGACVLSAGCGGGSEATAGEPSNTFKLEVVRASFPAKQSVAGHERMLLSVRNTSSETIPNLVATVDSFNYQSNFPQLADRKRPVWVIERGPGQPARPPVATQEVSVPGGGQTAYLNTWALGPLPAHHTETFFWVVVPVKPGAYTVRWALTAGLAGNAKARLAAGGPAAGHFHVVIAPKPPETHVDPKTGQVVPGPYAGNKAELGH